MKAAEVVQRAHDDHRLSSAQWCEGEKGVFTCSCPGYPTFRGGEYDAHRAEAVVNALRASGHLGKDVDL